MKAATRLSEVEREDIWRRSRRCLWDERGEAALKYLVKDRGLTHLTIREFGLGYVPDRARHWLAGRIIFPLRSPSGKLISLLTRRIRLSSASPLGQFWHESYDKDLHLYGLDLAKPYLRRKNFCVLVEGQFDVMQLYDKGVRNVVGLLSTNLSEIQYIKISRYCEMIVLVLDKDQNGAGQKAGHKILKTYGPGTVNRAVTIGRVTFEEFTDPDQFVRDHGINSLKELIRLERESLG